MVKYDVTMFHKRHLGGWDMLECVCAGFKQDFEFWEWEELQSLV